MRRSLKLLVPVAILLILIVIFGCKKMKENLLIGSWEIAAIAAVDSLEGPPLWTFHEGNIITSWSLHASSGDTVIDTGFYFVEQEFQTYFVSIHGLNQYLDGNYDVKKLSRTLLFLEQRNPYIHKEFFRKQ